MHCSSTVYCFKLPTHAQSRTCSVYASAAACAYMCMPVCMPVCVRRCACQCVSSGVWLCDVVCNAVCIAVRCGTVQCGADTVLCASVLLISPTGSCPRWAAASCWRLTWFCQRLEGARLDLEGGRGPAALRGSQRRTAAAAAQSAVFHSARCSSGRERGMAKVCGGTQQHRHENPRSSLAPSSPAGFPRPAVATESIAFYMTRHLPRHREGYHGRGRYSH